MSGRDVRRVAARASTTTHLDKQQQVTRLVLAALEHGVDEIYLAHEPFRINVRAVENLDEKHKVKFVEFPLTHTAEDSVSMVDRMWEAGCRTFIVLGGDGTNRIVARARPDATILPLSTGTNNVFPFMAEATVAGAAAGLIASGQLSTSDCCLRCKRVHVETESAFDIALVDAVMLSNDLLGNLMPFEPKKITAAVFAMAEPASIGMSPIAGYIEPCSHHDEFGVVALTGSPAAHRVRVPISAGLYGEVDLARLERVRLREKVRLEGPGILAFDGDRSLALEAGEIATLSVERDGPWIIEPEVVMRAAVDARVFAKPL
jgi:hypothetical protein